MNSENKIKNIIICLMSSQKIMSVKQLDEKIKMNDRLIKTIDDQVMQNDKLIELLTARRNELLDILIACNK